nr:PAS domain-containing protein [Flavisolibacter sp.]
TYSHVLERGYIIRNEAGKPTRMIGSIQNISEQKLNEALLAMERTLFELSANPDAGIKEVVDVMIRELDDIHPEASIAFIVLKDDLSPEYCAAPAIPELEKHLKGKIYPQDGSFGAAIHQKKSIAVHLVEEDELFVQYKEILQPFGFKSCWSLPILRNTGKVIGCFTLFFKVTRIPTPREKFTVEKLSNIFRIIWENYWSLHEIKTAKERFDLMLKATHDLIWDWDLETNQTYRDPEGLKNVYGLLDAARIPNIHKWLEFVHPDDLQKVSETLKNVVDSKKQNHFEIEYRFRKEDGSYSYVFDRGTIIRGANGKPLRMIGAAQDISERKRLEKELLNHELEHQKAINKATIETQELERREISKELHDNVNQVLTTTKLYLELALDNSELKDELISKSTKNIISVINEIRGLSRSLMDPSIGDLGLLASIHDLVESINLTGKIFVTLEADEKIELLFDSGQHLTVFRITQEALNNAIIHAQASKVKVVFTVSGQTAMVSIEDDGIGFDPEKVKPGMGLKNIQNRIYLINGKHKIESIPGKGSKILIEFPI